MLSNTLKPADGIPIGKHPEVVRRLKVCYNRNPHVQNTARPKYSTTWGLNQVLALFVSTLEGNDSLSSYMLTSKMVTLIVLLTLMRVLKIAAIGYKSLVFSQNGVKFA